VAVPDTLAAWRGFVDAQDPQPPTRLTATRLGRLTPTERETYDAARLGWLSSDLVFETEDVQTLTRLARVAVLRNQTPSATARRGLAVSGSPTLGKSTAVLHLGRVHERWVRARNPGRADLAPVIYVVVPAATSPKMLMLAFTRFLGLPVRPRATAAEITDLAVAVLRDLGTSMVILDEIHNLRSSRTLGAEAATALKTFSERLDATFVYAGMDLPCSDLFAGPIGEQLQGRMVVHQMRPFPFRTRSEQQAWCDVVDLCDRLVVLTRHTPGGLAGQARYLYDRTGGSLGSLRALLADAATTAILTGTERLTRRLLDDTPTDHRATRHTAAHPTPPNHRERTATRAAASGRAADG